MCIRDRRIFIQKGKLDCQYFTISDREVKIHGTWFNNVICYNKIGQLMYVKLLFNMVFTTFNTFTLSVQGVFRIWLGGVRGRVVLI